MKYGKIAVFSDCHLNDGTAKDDFSQTKKDGALKDLSFIETLRNLKKHGFQLIGAGDIVDLWQAAHQRIWNAHYVLLKYIERNVKWIKGNHDFSIFKPQSIKLVSRSGKRILISHGHQSNPNMLKFHVKAAVYIIGKLEKWFPWLDDPRKHPKLYKLLPKKYRGFFKKNFYKDKDSKIKKDVREWVKGFVRKYDIVITGHTHEQGAETLTSGGDLILWLDAGHCLEAKLQAVLYNLNNDKHEFV